MIPVQYNNASGIQQAAQLNGSPYINQLGYVNNDLVPQYDAYNSQVALRPRGDIQVAHQGRPRGDIQVVLQDIKQKYEWYVRMFDQQQFNGFFPQDDSGISVGVALLLYLWVFLALLIRIKNKGLYPDWTSLVDAQIEEVLYTLPPFADLIAVVIPSAALAALVDDNTFNMMSIHHSFNYSPMGLPPVPMTPERSPTFTIRPSLEETIIMLSHEFVTPQNQQKRKLSAAEYYIADVMRSKHDVRHAKRIITEAMIRRSAQSSPDYGAWTAEFLDKWMREYFTPSGHSLLEGFVELTPFDDTEVFVELTPFDDTEVLLDSDIWHLDELRGADSARFEGSEPIYRD